MEGSVDRHEMIHLLSELVRIDSVNPWLISGASGENKIGEFISDWAQPLGVEITFQEVENSRRNLILRKPGSKGTPSICLYAHLDTVGYAAWEDRALKPHVEGDRLYGLGASDDKGHCAAMLMLLQSIVQRDVKLEGDLILAFVVDEEGRSLGSMRVIEDFHPDAMIVLDSPFGLTNILTTHQGFIWLDIITQGNAVHSMDTDKGVDGIAHMAEIIVRLQELDKIKYTPATDPLNGKIIYHCAKVEGGTDYATYPAQCKLGLHLGTLPGETAQDRLREIEGIFRDVKSIYSKFNAEIQVNVVRPPFKAQGHEALWTILASEIEKICGQSPKPIGLNSWGDAALFQEAGIPTLMLGASGDNLHAPDEWVSIPELVKLVEILEATVERFCHKY